MLWLIVLTSCCIIFLLRLMWYRRRFYYLSSKLNGPFSWPLILNSLTFKDSSTVVNTTLQLCRAYRSPIRFWLGGNFIVLFDRPEEIEAVLTSPESLDKGNVYKHVKRMLGGDGLFSMGGEGWKLHRKLLNPTVQNYNILNSFYPSFNKNLRVMIKLLENKVGKGSFDIYHSLEACSLDMDLCLMLIIGKLIFQPWYRFYPIFRLSKYNQISEMCRNEARHYAKKVLDKNIDEFKNRNRIGERQNEEFEKRPVSTFNDELVRLSIEHQYFSEEEMITEALTMMSGGFETTALTVSYIVLMLALHPEYQERVFQELHDIFPEQRSDVTAEDIAKFQYTEQFIKESMRIAPTVPLVTRMAKNDLKIGKHKIPAGAELILSMISLHRNPNICGDVFDPDKRHPYSFIPFRLTRDLENKNSIEEQADC